MARRKKKNRGYVISKEEMHVARWQIRRYPDLVNTIYYYNNSHKGYDDKGVEREYKTELDIINNKYNQDLVNVIDYCLDQYVDPIWRKQVEEVAFGRKKLSELDLYDRESVDIEYKKLLRGFCKQQWLDTTIPVS